MRVARTLLAAIFTLAPMGYNSWAQEPNSTTETYGSWTYRCNQITKEPDAEKAAKKACELVPHRN